MQNKTLGFIGAGRIARIMLSGWQKAERMPSKVIVSDTDDVVLAALQQQFPGITLAHNNDYLIAESEIIFLALHLPVVQEVLVQFQDQVKPGSLLISLMPKFSIKDLSALSGLQRVVRMIPNAPSIINRGYNPIAFSTALPDSEKEEILSLLRPLGECPEVPESDLEAYAILTAMGPTYLWFQLYELQKLGKSFGLAEADIATGIRQMVRGAVDTMCDGNLSPEQVMDLIAVTPLQDKEESIKQLYQSRLKALFEKLTR